MERTTPTEGLALLRSARGSGELDALCVRHRIEVLAVFGSVARAEPAPRDLDIGVLAEHGAEFDLFGLITEIVDLIGSEQVDVAHLNAAGPVLRERALVDSIVLYESKPGSWARACTAAVMERMDTDWLRRLDLELLAG